MYKKKKWKIQKNWKNNVEKQNKKRNKSKIGYKEKKRIQNEKSLTLKKRGWKFVWKGLIC